MSAIRIAFLVIGLLCSQESLSNLLPEKITYPFTREPIDVVIMLHPKDMRTIDMCIEGLQNNVENIGTIYIVSQNKLTEQGVWIPEDTFSFSKYDIALEMFDQNEDEAIDFLSAPDTRIGWVYKQIMLFYAPVIIEGISSNVLMIDADTIFFKPVSFQDEEGNPLFNVGKEYHEVYFEHAGRLILGLEKQYSEHSGITHHMLFQRQVIYDLFDHIMFYHQLEPWKAIARCIDKAEAFKSCMSEYEIYFNFIFARSEQPKIRKLKWANDLFKRWQRYRDGGYDYASFHTWLDEMKMRRR